MNSSNIFRAASYPVLLSLLVIPVLGFAAVQAPVLKWQYGGCYNSWCETGWYSSPAVADINNDGINDVIASAYSIVALDGPTGALLWRVNSGHDRSETGVSNVGRTWPAIVVQDINNDGTLEIVTAHGGGWVSAYTLQGYFLSGWPKHPLNNELRGLLVADLDHDGTSEIVASGAVSNQINTWVYEHNGSLRSGWPQLTGDTGYAYGVFNDNAAAGDLDEDGELELVVPSDVHYICSYNPDGIQVQANSIYGDKKWGKVGIWESLVVELRGWGECNGVRSESYRTNFAHGAAVVADVNGDGIPEVVATGNVYDCAVGHPPGKYTGVYIFNADRSRFKSGGFDWEQPPVDTGAPLSEDYNVIQNNQPNPVVTDLDGDGNKEILFSSYDGRVHAFWLDKTEHHSWPYSVYKPAEGFFRFASEPAVADLDNDGYAEVIFSSWTQSGSNANGKLHILSSQGDALFEIDLPAKKSSSPDITWNGALAAPTLANIDSDSDLEIILNTAFSGFVAYDLPGTATARVLWASGRAGRIWHKTQLTNEQLLENIIRVMQALAGKRPSEYPDENDDGVIEMTDAFRYFQEIAR